MTGAAIPEGRIVPIAGVDFRVEAGEHPWHAANRAEVERHWEAERVRRPFLFNGRIVMHRGLTLLPDGRVAGTSHVVPYANLLYFLSRPNREADIWHLFATPVLVSCDGAVLLTRMSERTANAGRIYSPSGSLDPDDIRDGACDLDGNMAREVREETGLDLDAARAEEGGFLHAERHVVSAFRRFRFDRPAAELAAEMTAHIAAEEDPEVVEAVIVRGPADITPAVPGYMAAMLHFHFGKDGGG